MKRKEHQQPVIVPCPHCGGDADDYDMDGIAYCLNGCGLVRVSEIESRVAGLLRSDQ